MAHTFLAGVLDRPPARDEVFRALDREPTWVALSNGAVLAPTRHLPFRSGVHLVPATARIDAGASPLPVLVALDTDVRSGSAVRTVYLADGPFWGEVTGRASDVTLRHSIGETRLSDHPSARHVGPEGTIEEDAAAPLRARTVFEAHVYMAVRGYPAPKHAVRAEGDALVSTYEGDDGRVFRFELPEPGITSRFGAGASTLLAPETLTRHAYALARGTSADLGAAIDTLEQVLAFGGTPAAADRVKAVVAVWRAAIG